MTYTKAENIANACLHISVMAKDMELEKDQLIKLIEQAWKVIEKVEDKEEFVKSLFFNALIKLKTQVEND